VVIFIRPPIATSLGWALIMAWSKEYKREYKKKYRLEHKDEISEYNKKWRIKNYTPHPRVRKTEEEKTLYRKKYRSENPQKIRDSDKKWYLKNKDKVSKWGKEYRLKNKDKIFKQRKEYREKNKDKRNLYLKKQYNSNIQFKLRIILRGRLNKALKNNQKIGCAIRDLGCTISELKFHVEGQFQQGMSWDNWKFDGWHLDHRIPLAFYDLTDRKQFLKAFHYTNLQPLWASENMSKNGRRKI